MSKPTATSAPDHRANPKTALLTKGATVDNRYQIVRVLASGGMADVYEVYDTVTRMGRALKMLQQRHLRKEVLIEKHFAEGRVLKATSHSGLVKVFDYGLHDGVHPYYVMELLVGATLHEKIYGEPGKPRPHPLALSDVLEWMIQLCEAVQHLHENGIIHRDLKPDNVFVTTAGEVKGLDLSAAKFGAMGLPTTQTGRTFGTPHYMCPEHIHGTGKECPAWDVYALGFILFELLAQRYMFSDRAGQAHTNGELCSWHAHRPRPLLRDIDPRFAPELDHIIQIATAIRAEDRFQSAEDLRDTLVGARDAILERGDMGRMARRSPSAEEKALRFALATTTPTETAWSNPPPPFAPPPEAPAEVKAISAPQSGVRSTGTEVIEQPARTAANGTLIIDGPALPRAVEAKACELEQELSAAQSQLSAATTAPIEEPDDEEEDPLEEQRKSNAAILARVEAAPMHIPPPRERTTDVCSDRGLQPPEASSRSAPTEVIERKTTAVGQRGDSVKLHDAPVVEPAKATARVPSQQRPTVVRGRVASLLVMPALVVLGALLYRWAAAPPAASSALAETAPPATASVSAPAVTAAPSALPANDPSPAPSAAPLTSAAAAVTARPRSNVVLPAKPKAEVTPATTASGTAAAVPSPARSPLDDPNLHDPAAPPKSRLPTNTAPRPVHK